MAYAVAQAHLCVINTSAVDHNLAHTGRKWEGLYFFTHSTKGGKKSWIILRFL